MSFKKLKIALLSTPWESVPPPKYGGTERVVALLADGLARRGHAVTLFTTGDSKSRAKMDYVYKKSGYRSGVSYASKSFPLLHASYAFQKIQKGKFDLVHNHFAMWGAAFAPLLSTPCITTYHADASISMDENIFGSFEQILHQTPLVSISDAQKKYALPGMHWFGKVYNGIDMKEFSFQPKSGDYALWIGRLDPKKGATEAIAVAESVGMKLILASRIDPSEKEYFDNQIKPHLNNNIRFVGEVGGKKRIQLFRNAKVLLMPISWHEPFGLVMTEAMACGTPVIAHGLGAVPEVVKNGVTGFITKTRADMVSAVRKIDTIDRHACRERVEKYFSAEKMVENYESLYYRFLASRKKRLS